MKVDKIILLIFIAGTIARLSLATLPGMKVDTDVWFAWALRLNEVGFANFYSNDVWTNYTPGFLYALSFLGWLKNLFNFDTNTFNYILKLPAIIADFLIAIFICKIILGNFSINWSRLTIFFLYLNPALIFNSSVWGQIDSILAAFLLLTVYYLSQNKFILSSVLFGIAFLIKPQALGLLPVMGLFLLRNFSLERLIKLLFPGLLTVLVFFLPFFINDPIKGPLQLFYKMVGDYPLNSLFAYNFWGVMGFWISDMTIWNYLSLKEWGYLLYGLYWIIILWFFSVKKLNFFRLSTLALLSFFFLPTRVHERYLYPALLFLVVSAWYFKSKLLLAITGVLSLLHLANLYYVYVYYNEIFLGLPKTLFIETLYNSIEKNSKLLSLVSTAFFALISFIIIKSHEKNK